MAANSGSYLAQTARTSLYSLRRCASSTSSGNFWSQVLPNFGFKTKEQPLAKGGPSNEAHFPQLHVPDGPVFAHSTADIQISVTASSCYSLAATAVHTGKAYPSMTPALLPRTALVPGMPTLSRLYSTMLTRSTCSRLPLGFWPSTLLLPTSIPCSQAAATRSFYKPGEAPPRAPKSLNNSALRVQKSAVLRTWPAGRGPAPTSPVDQDIIGGITVLVQRDGVLLPGVEFRDAALRYYGKSARRWHIVGAKGLLATITGYYLQDDKHYWKDDNTFVYCVSST